MRQGKVLLTGVNGFLGQHILDFFLKKNIKVIGFGRSEKNTIDHPNYRFIKGDLSELSKFQDQLIGVDTVIHAAASFAGPKEQILSTNLAGTEEVCDLCKSLGVKRLSFISTFAVAWLSADEKKQPLWHSDYYAWTKHKAEKTCREQLGTSATKYSIIRPTSIFSDKHTNSSSISSILQKWAKTRSLALVPSAKINLISADSVSQVIYDECCNQGINRTINLVGDDLTFKELIKILAKHKPLVFELPFAGTAVQLVALLASAFSVLTKRNSELCFGKIKQYFSTLKQPETNSEIQIHISSRDFLTSFSNDINDNQ